MSTHYFIIVSILSQMSTAKPRSISPSNPSKTKLRRPSTRRRKPSERWRQAQMIQLFFFPPPSLFLSLSPILSLSLSISIYLSLSISLSLFLSDSLTLFSSLFSIYLSSYYISKYHSHNRTTSKEHDVFLQWRRSSIRSIDQRCTAGTPII